MTQPSGGLFGSSPPAAISTSKEEPKADAPKTSLFGVKTTGSLFNKSKSLFTGPSLFSKDAKHEDPKKTFISSGGDLSKEEEKEEDEQEQKKDDKPAFVPANKDPYTKIFNRAVERFKTTKQDKGNGHLSIETGKTGDNRFVIVNFRNPIGKTLFTGQIVPNCKKGKAMDKPGKIQTKVVLVERNEKENKLSPIPALISFIRSDDKNEFDKKWDEAIGYLKE